MNHEDTLRDMSVERYLLGELTGDARNRFEEHLFECPQCASDLKSGMALLEGARVELATVSLAEAPKSRKSSFWSWLLSPAWMVPALAACLGLVVYQSLFLVPDMKRQLAEAKAPAVLNSLMLAGGTARGDSLPKVSAPADGYFLLSVDIPPLGDYSSYVCSLYSPAGAVVWTGQVSPEQAKDTVQIQVPAAITQSGTNTLLVQGVRQDGAGAKMDILATDKFALEVHK
jgi:hypothetical protein